MKLHNLKKARPEYVIRLAKWLGLKTDRMGHQQISKLIYWKITRRDKRARGLASY